MVKSGEIIIDSDIPFIRGVLDSFFDVCYIKGEAINKSKVKNAKALIVRTRTRCDGNLLDGSKVKAIFSATIGSDHIDTDYCAERGISVFTAAGCNAYGVVQYVLTSLFALLKDNESDIKNKTIGVIGAGNVGERLANLLDKSGINVMRCDPPKSLVNKDRLYYNLHDVAAKSDIVTIHVPLDQSTERMFSVDFFETLKEGVYFVNSSRGEVIDEKVLLDNRSKLGGLIMDVWSGEPFVNRELVKCSDISTPHIAGYSLEGKRNATVMTIKSFARFFNIDSLKNFNVELPQSMDASIDANCFGTVNPVAEALLKMFPVWAEDKKLKTFPQDFEKIRSAYEYRREPSSDFYSRLSTFLSSAK